MHLNILYAVGGLIEQRTKAQLMRDWENNQADVRPRGKLGPYIIAFFGWMTGVWQVNFEIGAVRKA